MRGASCGAPRESLGDRARVDEVREVHPKGFDTSLRVHRVVGLGDRPELSLPERGIRLARLEKEMGKLEGDIKRTEGKLSNANFVDKAPEAVVQKERDKLAEAKAALENLTTQAEKIRAL